MKTILLIIFLLANILYSQAYSQTIDAAIGSIQTSATGATWVAIGAGRARTAHLINDTGTAIEFRLSGAGSSINVASNTGFSIRGIVNLSEIEIRRTDVSGTQVTMKYLYETAPIW